VNIYNSFASVPLIENAVLALGTFDGMHLAHRYLVEKVCQAAKDIDGNSVVVSFRSHPRKTILEDFHHGVLTTPSEKTDILAEIGLNNLIIMDFTTKISTMSYIDFIHFLQTKINIQKIVLGYNHHFGKNREGCYATLLNLGKELYFEVEEIEKQTIDGLDISSSSIRHAIHCGDIETANKLLGYNYSIDLQIFSDKSEIFFDKNKLLPQNGRYKIKIEGCDFFLTVKNSHLSIDNNIGIGINKIEFIQAIK
jgi:riboflavin kinase/FMN adenylyltransferase